VVCGAAPADSRTRNVTYSGDTVSIELPDCTNAH
jgi:hypothetical protein